MSLRTLIFFLFCFSFSSCKKQGGPAKEGTPVSEPGLPSVPSEILNQLMDECTGIDYVFNELPFSLSFQEEPGIDQNIAFIDPYVPVGLIPPGCKPLARKLFLIKGEIAYEADVYYSGKCQFYVFIGKDKKPQYANGMTRAGIEYYKQVFQQAQGMGQQTQ
ncbi:MAG: hypothetical protein LW630_12095 [Saprospiraceae bacterium]|jgi:hypothetical protein|nr:hypothetical protein [Saprospiraceae bacterium]